MKKNRSMSVAALLLALTLITSCFVGGTFAKYTTVGEAEDSARVALWGIEISAEGSLFDDIYLNAKEGNTPAGADFDKTNEYAKLSVVSYPTANVVAPGTKNEEGLTFTIDGMSEVAVALAIDIDATDIVLEAGEYDDYTTGDADDTFELEDDYHPIKFTLANSGGTPIYYNSKDMEDVTLAEIEACLEAFSNENIGPVTDITSSKVLNQAGTHADGTFVLTWEWAINGNDKADTYLGLEETAQEISFEMTITAEQID